MSVDHALLGNYIAELYATNTLEERFQIYEKYLQLLGFEGATYTFAARAQWEAFTDIPAIFLHTATYSTEFLQHYEAERLDQQDFTVRKVLGGDIQPMDWREHETQAQLNPDEKHLIQLAREDYGIINAISIPTMFDERGAAGASIVSSEKDHAFQVLKQERLDTLIHCTKLFHDINFADASLPHKFILPLLASLKSKEIVVLRYLASGKPFKNIQDSTDISYFYATNILDGMRNRLGKITKDKLLYLVGLLNILDQLK
ncbi:MAG: hypothetical protein RL122_1310 [Pseudomonadota bacterium]|jgi:hypothetical protein|uniref:Autoinducer binding domain-containing protein n=1 Tax=Thiothrix fructosivorans TaxID=111770 RepID=A0A8B0SLM1_9GAMM|nr:autoinducer binding domain-containing protein [Thiothrix fructosivorans]MBO0612554.1 autoinducer binding domain-containing protein [Thiothrix fructosivorans]QTX11971.1 autoinducer binding domain-containing protein [Thiothrix fructosivorans]